MKSSEESPGGNIERYNSGPWIPKHMVRYPMTLRTQSLFKIAMKILWLRSTTNIELISKSVQLLDQILSQIGILIYKVGTIGQVLS